MYRRTTQQKLADAYARLYRSVLNRSKFIYPIYTRQTIKRGKEFDAALIARCKRAALRLVTAERIKRNRV